MERGSIALHIGKSVAPGMSYQNHYTDLGRDVSLVWNFCAHSSDVISWGNQWWGCKMSAVFPGEILARSNGGLEGRLGMKLLCFKLTNSKKAKKSCFQLICTFYLFSPSRPPPSGRKNVMSMRELFCPDPLAGFEKMAGFQIFYRLKIKCFHS